MLRWLWDNLSSLLLALILALTVWVAAVSAEDPIEERAFTNPIPIELRGQPEGLLMLNDPPSAVRITLRAPQSVWDDLSSDDIEVWADLASISSGEQRLQLEYDVGLRPAEVTRLEPSAITIRAEPAATKELPIDIEVNGEPAVGYRASLPAISPDRVTLTGPSSAVSRVDGVQAEVDISGRSQDVTEESALIALDAEGNRVEDALLDPATVEISIAIEDLGGYRSVVVSPRIQGEVEPGYQLTQITVSPTLVRVFSSDPQVISELSGFVETEPVSLEGATEQFERRVGVDLPEGVSIVGEQSVLVRVSISPIQTSITVNESVEFQGLGQDLFAQASPSAVNLILNGPLPLLDDLDPGDVRVVLDLAGLTSGTHQVTPDVIVAPPEARVQSVLPDTVEVTISTEPPPSPTAPPADS